MDKKPKGQVRLIELISKIPLPILKGIARFFSAILTASSQVKTLAVIRLNLEIAYPNLTPTALNVLFKNAIRNEITSYFEFMHIWGSSNKKNIQRIQHIEGEHLFHQALEKKNGVVFIIPHFGTWEVLNGWLSQYTDLTIMYKPIKNSAVDTFVRNARSQEHANLVPTDESGVRQIFRALKQNGATAILPDHSPDHVAELVEWFGIPLYSSQLSAKMIQKTKAETLLLYAIRNDNHGFDIHIESIDQNIYDSTVNGTHIIHQSIEQLIQRYPEHYHWSYKRFNANPHTSDIYNLPHEQAVNIIRKIQHSRL